MANRYDHNHLAMIEVLNTHVGQVLWYEFLRDEYRARGGNVRDCSGVLARLARHFGDCVEFVPLIGDRRMVVNKVQIVKKIENYL